MPSRVRWVLLTFVVVLLIAVPTLLLQGQNLYTVRTILNDVWDKSNHQLMGGSWAGAQQIFETETTILNDVWDKDNHYLRIGGTGQTLTIQEIDGAPTGTPTTLKVSNTALTDNGDGSFTLVTGAGGGGDFSSDTSTSVDGEVVLFSGTGGKTGKRATGTGVARVASGVYSAAELSGDCSTSGSNVVTCVEAAADGVTKGKAAFTAADFNSASGVISIDYTNGQAASGSVKGFLTSTDWTTFNDKQDTVTAGDSLTKTGNDIDCDAASDIATGCVELATAAETTTGTDATRAVTPDGLSQSVFGEKYVTIEVVPDATALTTGDGKAYFPVHTNFNGWLVVGVSGHVGAVVSSSGAVTVDIDVCGAVATGIRCSGTNRDLLSTNITIDANEDGTETAATPAVIDTANDDLATGEWLRFNIDGAGTSTQGLYVTVIMRKP